MNQTEIKEAIAEQEEYIKRRRSCGGRQFVDHSWDTFSAAPGVFYSACWRCRVTQTPADYAIRQSVTHADVAALGPTNQDAPS